MRIIVENSLYSIYFGSHIEPYICAKYIIGRCLNKVNIPFHLKSDNYLVAKVYASLDTDNRYPIYISCSKQYRFCHLLKISPLGFPTNNARVSNRDNFEVMSVTNATALGENRRFNSTLQSTLEINHQFQAGADGQL